jgi:hypothetical protein
MLPSHAINLVNQLVENGDLIVQDDVLILSPRLSAVKPAQISSEVDSDISPVPKLGKLIRQFVGESRLSRAVGMSDSSIILKNIRKKPLRIEAQIKGTRVYRLVLDEGAKLIQHDCPDWLRKRKLRRFCKHVAKIFLLLEKDDAVRILSSMKSKSWQFQEL